MVVRVEVARRRMLLGLVENGEERVEPALVDRDAALIERKRHWLRFPPENGPRTAAAGHGCTQSVTLSTRGRRPLGGWFEIRRDHRPRFRALTTGTISNVTPQSRHSR